VSRRQRREGRGGAEALKLRLSLRCLPLTDIPQSYALPYTTLFVCGGERCVVHGGGAKSAILRPQLPCWFIGMQLAAL